MSKIGKSFKKWGLGWKSLVGYLLIAVAVLGFVFLGSKKPEEEESIVASINKLNNDNSLISVSQLTEITMVANLAETARLPAQSNASNLAFSLILQHAMAQSGDGAVGGGLIEAELSRGITQYTVREGESLAGIAQQHNISTQTIRWSNSMKNENVSVGQILLIPSVDGFIYTVKSGDSVDGLAGRYSSSVENILIYNDLENSELKEGMKIIIPDGVLPETERPEYVAPVYTPPSYSGSSSGGYYSSWGETISMQRNTYPYTDNSYAYGWCTWYAAVRRAELGNPIGRNWGNASSWAYTARANGIAVGGTPQVGAIMANGGGYGGYGHVAIVEEVGSDYIIVSEMNGPGGLWMIDRRKIPMSSAVGGSYRYIY